MCLVGFWFYVSGGHAGDAGVCGEEVDDAGVVFDGPGDSCMSWGLLGSAQRSWVQRKYRCAPIEYSLKACGEKEAIVLPSLSQSQRLSGESGISLIEAFGPRGIFVLIN